MIRYTVAKYDELITPTVENILGKETVALNSISVLLMHCCSFFLLIRDAIFGIKKTDGKTRM